MPGFLEGKLRRLPVTLYPACSYLVGTEPRFRVAAVQIKNLYFQCSVAARCGAVRSSNQWNKAKLAGCDLGCGPMKGFRARRPLALPYRLCLAAWGVHVWLCLQKSPCVTVRRKPQTTNDGQPLLKTMESPYRPDVLPWNSLYTEENYV